jgi:membrane-bound lytic murein transglycosylase B
VSYALSVSLLAEQLAGKPAMRATWPADDKSLSKAEREELQQLLTKLGHDTGPPDGIIGNGTRGAIRAFQKAETLPQDGHPSADLLGRLRTARAKLPN